jgi:hypothetical protein
MWIELEEGDLELLDDVLATAIGELSPEIADTDNPAFRRDLKTRRDRLVAVRAHLAQAAPERPAS